ncbi:DNA binding domain protein [Mycobacterium phage Gengar]|uniref:Membrane protein n=1 Tax=Mycobacterium phage Gengar TaxID=1891963 RepID=A0A1C9EGV4_9CAUD|nr:DNA binding domain protein [Mycobacterium phage Gengar]AON96724.1 membrane protein [Mycobacterium phage Gengar]
MTAHTDARASAVRYFRGWLAAAVATSILGNVAHALLSDAGSPTIAAAIAFLLPLGLLGSTHGVHKLVAAGIVGRAYTSALWISVATVVAAFALSFVALAELAAQWAGIPVFIAWLVPVFVDLSITGCTVALFALSDAARADVLEAQPAPMRVDTQPAPMRVDTRPEPAAPAAVRSIAHTPVHVDAQPVRVDVDDTAPQIQPGPPAARLTVADVMARTERERADAERVADDHLAAAERIVAAGVTRIDRGKVAQVLHAHAQNTAPSMIARKLNVGYPTVQRIIEHATVREEVNA